MHTSAAGIFGLKSLPSYLPGQRGHPSLRSELLNLAGGWCCFHLHSCLVKPRLR